MISAGSTSTTVRVTWRRATSIVDKADGKLYITGTAHPIEHYLEEHRLGHRTLA
jgi:hypothetical protein